MMDSDLTCNNNVKLVVSQLSIPLLTGNKEEACILETDAEEGIITSDLNRKTKQFDEVVNHDNDVETTLEEEIYQLTIPSLLLGFLYGLLVPFLIVIDIILVRTLFFKNSGVTLLRSTKSFFMTEYVNILTSVSVLTTIQYFLYKYYISRSMKVIQQRRRRREQQLIDLSYVLNNNEEKEQEDVVEHMKQNMEFRWHVCIIAGMVTTSTAACVYKNLVHMNNNDDDTPIITFAPRTISGFGITLTVLYLLQIIYLITCPSTVNKVVASRT